MPLADTRNPRHITVLNLNKMLGFWWGTWNESIWLGIRQRLLSPVPRANTGIAVTDTQFGQGKRKQWAKHQMLRYSFIFLMTAQCPYYDTKHALCQQLQAYCWKTFVERTARNCTEIISNVTTNMFTHGYKIHRSLTANSTVAKNSRRKLENCTPGGKSHLINNEHILTYY